MIMTEIKWDKECIACSEPEMTKELLKKSLWNPERPTKGAWRQDMQEYLTRMHMEVGGD